MILLKNFRRAGLYAILHAALGAVLFLPVMSPGRAVSAEAESQKVLQDVWERYLEKSKGDAGSASEGARPAPPASGSASNVMPGRHLGSAPELAAFAKDSIWQYRPVTYELYFDSGEPLARAIFGLARLSGDIRYNMPLVRFEKGAQGFHYSIDQVIHWANGLLADSKLAQTKEELELLELLLKDGVIVRQGNKAAPGGKIKHVLGAAPGKKRDFWLNLRHERLHILWDEDPNFAESFRQAWAKLTPQEKEAVYDKLKGYSRENEPQLIEEWAIYQAEELPEKERRKLIGI